MVKFWIDIFIGLILVSGLFLCIFVIGRGLMFSIFMVQWTFNELFSIKMLRCIISDSKNIINFLLFLSISAIGLLIIFFSITRENDYFLLGILLIMFILFAFIFWKIRVGMYNDSLYAIDNYTCSKNFSENVKYHAIVIAKNRDDLYNYFISDCISILVKNFREHGIKYKIFICEKKKEFVDIYSNNKIIGLWIFGHGAYSYLNLQDGNLLYKDLPNISIKKEFIGQFHCNPCGGISLIDKNHPKFYFVTKGIRIAMQNRCYLLNDFPLKKSKIGSF